MTSNHLSWNNTRSAIHEFGHAVGLTHETASGFRNLMVQSGGGANITSQQRVYMLNAQKRINVGPNSLMGMPYPFVHDPMTGEAYKADHLLNWTTRYGKK